MKQRQLPHRGLFRCFLLLLALALGLGALTATRLPALARALHTGAGPAAKNTPQPGTGLAVENILQKPQLPNGCEITSLAIVLAYWEGRGAGFGLAHDKMTLAENHLPRMDFGLEGGARTGPDPREYYAGDPASSGGFYCFAGPIVQAAESFFTQAGSGFAAEDRTGATGPELEACIDQGLPVIVWATLDGSPPRPAACTWRLPTGESYELFGNLHCLVLRGYDKDQYYLCDPLAGQTAMDKERFLESYRGLGSQAVVVLPPMDFKNDA